ncbi:hypothetical protein K4A83_15775 [Spirulina subsalsa FACHB-351]|uniref:Uncharacterized protein n=1 Tax=Spirulina subsalsa FACHB-351 TaxID=234711 RepID=A0ABT3L9E4_9CYAN|nr:hypothetical protein [Spirulina subsalsa]MCW6037719.1 hypothetical protein [Spirulina subsalsa FACHB-351]
MRVWMVSFGLLFGLVELYGWFQSVTVPLWVYVGVGVFLAIASNRDLIPRPLSLEEEQKEQ